MFLPHPCVKVSIVGSLRDREVACSASDRQGSNFESCVWRTVSSQSSHHLQGVLLAQFSLCVHEGGLKPDSLSFNHTHNFTWVKGTHICFIAPLQPGDRLKSSESDVCRRHILTTKVDPRAVRYKIFLLTVDP